MISEDMTAATFSLESEDGISRSLSLSGNGRPGLAPARASRSASPAKAKGKRTPDTCGPLFTASSPSADLQRCLASRLAERLDVNGSPEYALTWKEVDMPWGPPICALRASGRRISDNGSGGWPTPKDTDSRPTVNPEVGLRRFGEGRRHLCDAVTMAGWETPRVTTNGGHGNPERAADGKARLADQVQGWATPSARDWRSEAGPGHDARMAETRGQPLSRQTATTGGRGALAPEFSRWLMGYPAGWESYADSATPSCPR